MSLNFSDTTNFKGIVQIYEKECGFERGYISGNTNRMKEFTADVNLALDDYFGIGIQASGRWQLDDSNHSKYPEIKTDLIQNQRDYTFTTDEEGALILDIYKVMVADENGTFREIYPVDQQSSNSPASFYDGIDTTGVPQWYDKTANGILFDVLPSYNYRNVEEGGYGVKVFINRESSYFVHTDTTKKPGVPGLHHRYFAIKPAFDYARRNGLSTEASLRNEIQLMERDIKEYLGGREKDTRKVLRGRITNYK